MFQMPARVTWQRSDAPHDVFATNDTPNVGLDFALTFQNEEWGGNLTWYQTGTQPFVVTALASHQLPKRWRVGARTRVSAGNPYTPVVNRSYSLDQRAFQPVYGDRDSARLPPFYSVDVRIDKDWVYDDWTLTAYLDVQNATNAQNIETMSWTYDYAEEDPITSLPVVPALGVRGEW